VSWLWLQIQQENTKKAWLKDTYFENRRSFFVIL
jgi:hypothetical protein